MHQPDPTFPPMFTAHAVKAPLTARDEACRRAALGEIGAGDVVWSRNAAKAECALVLEPEVTLARACQMSALGFVALAETLGAVGPPQLPLEIRWPGSVLVNSAACGEIALIAPTANGEVVPQWMVLSIALTLTLGNDKREPGHRDDTALDLEGAGDVTRSMVIEALATRLLAWLHTWGEDGFRPIHDQWLYYAEGRKSDVAFDGAQGRVLGLDEDGGLLFKANGSGVRIVPYIPHVRVWS